LFGAVSVSAGHLTAVQFSDAVGGSPSVEHLGQAFSGSFSFADNGIFCFKKRDSVTIDDADFLPAARYVPLDFC